ncbi:MAG: HAMP domain-containing sensor histidine kinase, partial [Sulfurimonadaceae bacterium]
NEANTFELESVINDATSLVSGLLKKHHVTLENRAGLDLTMHNRKNALLQVLLILLHNAIDAINTNQTGDGCITISAEHQQEQIIIEVCDNGGGIAPKHLSNIFEPYFTTKGKSHGTGLGLYIASSLAKHYLQGDLTVQNRGEGACFTLRIAATLSLDK